MAVGEGEGVQRGAELAAGVVTAKHEHHRAARREGAPPQASFTNPGGCLLLWARPGGGVEVVLGFLTQPAQSVLPCHFGPKKMVCCAALALPPPQNPSAHSTHRQRV